MNVPQRGSAVWTHIQSRLPQANHGVDADHRCQIGTCKFVSWPVKWHGQHAHLHVCTKSLQYHVCGNNLCSGPKETARDGTTVCAISATEVCGPKEMYYPSRSKGRGSWARPFSHSMTTEKSSRKPRRGKSAKQACIAAVECLFMSTSAVALRKEANRRQANALRRRLAQNRSAPHFYDAMDLARQTFARRSIISQTKLKENIRRLGSDIAVYLANVRPYLQQCKGYPALCAACVGFLATGLEVGGVTLFPRIQWIAELSPRDTDYGKIPGFQSRPLSVASRSIKTTACTAVGAAKTQFIFKYTGQQ